MIISSISKLQSKLKKIEYQCADPKKEFENIIQPKRYKIPVFGNLGESNCLYVDFLFVSKYNRDEKFNKETQWNKRESVKVYAKLISKNDNRVLFDILEELKFADNTKANKILINYCVSQLESEINEVKEKSKILYRMVRGSDRFRQKNIMNLLLFLFIPFMIVLLAIISMARR